MFAAILKGKVAKSEDLVTSIVFGTLEHLPIGDGLLPLLARMDAAPPWVKQVRSFEVQYWPWWRDEPDRKPAEPDVVLLCSAGEQRYLLVVECKWRVGKSGEGERDQLARQVCQGSAAARKAGVTFAGLLYLTDHAVVPRTELEDSRRVLAEWGVPPAPLWWLSWRHVAAVLEQAARRSPSAPRATSATLADEAARCLRRWGLDHRLAMRDLVLRPLPPWTFGREQ